MIRSQERVKSGEGRRSLVDISEAEHERYISHLLNSLGKRLEREEHRCAREKLERELLVAGLRAASRYKNLVNAVRFLEWLEAEGRKLEELDAELAKEYLAYLKRRKHKDLRGAAVALRGLASLLGEEREEEIRAATRGMGKTPRQPRISAEELLSEKEIRKITRHLPPMYRTMLALAAETGLRLKELRSLRIKDVEPCEWGFRLRVRREYTKTPAGERTVAVVKSASMLAHWLALHPRPAADAFLLKLAAKKG